MINRREFIVGAVVGALVPTRVEAFQLPEDRLISKARIIMEAHAGDMSKAAHVAIRDSLLKVFESEQKYCSFLTVKFGTGDSVVIGNLRVHPVINMIEYLAFGETVPKYIRMDHTRQVLLTDEEYRDIS